MPTDSSSAPFELVPPTPSDAPILGEIVFHAFKDLFDRHGVPIDFPDVQTAVGMMGAFTTRPDVYGIVAKANGQIIGSNFVQLTDPVAGIGPITVRSNAQSKGVGRALMKHIIDYSLKHHGPQVRLVQDAINMTSLSLYTSLGFDVREPLVLFEMPPAKQADPTVRRVTLADVDACAEICQRVFKVSRKNELAGAVQHGQAFGMVPYLRERDGRIVGYVIPSFLGHSVAERNEDLIAVLTTAIRELPPFSARFLCPSRNADLYRHALAAGGRALRACHMMSMGPYESPVGAWYPSIAY